MSKSNKIADSLNMMMKMNMMHDQRSRRFSIKKNKNLLLFIFAEKYVWMKDLKRSSNFFDDFFFSKILKVNISFKVNNSIKNSSAIVKKKYLNIPFKKCSLPLSKYAWKRWKRWNKIGINPFWIFKELFRILMRVETDWMTKQKYRLKVYKIMQTKKITKLRMLFA